MPTVTGTGKCACCGKPISANKETCAACAEKPRGELSILNVGTGDIKISFSTASVSEVIRAKRIITDMLRRGYALVVEVERNGERAWERVQEFDEKRGEYLIADLDSVAAQQADEHDKQAADIKKTGLDDGPEIKPRRGRPPKYRKGLPMENTKATAVGRSAGG